MTEQQRQAFEAVAILRAHANLFIGLIDDGNISHLQEQIQNLQRALADVVAIAEQQKQAA